MGFFDSVKAALGKVTQDNPVATTAGDEDHSNPDVFRGEDADAPVNEEVTDK